MTFNCGAFTGLSSSVAGSHFFPNSSNSKESGNLNLTFPPNSIWTDMLCIIKFEKVSEGLNSTQDVIERGSEGLLIKDVVSGMCLSWKSDLGWGMCVFATLWVFEPITWTDGEPNREIHVNVHPFNYHHLCLESSMFDEISLPIAFLSNCSGDLRQVLILQRSSESAKLQSNFDIVGSDRFYIFTDEKARNKQNTEKSLTHIRVLQSSENSGPCYLENLRVKNGMIVEIPPVPFFLPGSNLTVRCLKGYGIKEAGFREAGWFVCVNALTKPPPCSKASNRMIIWILDILNFWIYLDLDFFSYIWHVMQGFESLLTTNRKLALWKNHESLDLLNHLRTLTSAFF